MSLLLFLKLTFVFLANGTLVDAYAVDNNGGAMSGQGSATSSTASTATSTGSTITSTAITLNYFIANHLCPPSLPPTQTVMW